MYRGARESQPRILKVATQNILLDKTRAESGVILEQSVRLPAMTDTLAQYGCDYDLVAIQEAQESKGVHNGKNLSQVLGYGEGVWVTHNKKPHKRSKTGRKGEHVGLFGNAVEEAVEIDLGDRRKAVVTEIAGVAFACVHLRSGADAREKRYMQARALIEALSEYKNAVVLGDLNEPAVPFIAKARSALRRAGYRSVFSQLDLARPNTYPVGSYAEIMHPSDSRRDRIIRRGWSIDDILARGPRISVLAAGVLRAVPLETDDQGGALLEPSDHVGLWAELEIAP